jgi:hypothetical protein
MIAFFLQTLRRNFAFRERADDDSFQVIGFLFNDFECGEENGEFVSFKLQAFSHGRGKLFRSFASGYKLLLGFQCVLQGRA